MSHAKSQRIVDLCFLRVFAPLPEIFRILTISQRSVARKFSLQNSASSRFRARRHFLGRARHYHATAFLRSPEFARVTAWGRAEILRSRPRHHVYVNA